MGHNRADRMLGVAVVAQQVVPLDQAALQPRAALAVVVVLAVTRRLGAVGVRQLVLEPRGLVGALARGGQLLHNCLRWWLIVHNLLTDCTQPMTTVALRRFRFVP